MAADPQSSHRRHEGLGIDGSMLKAPGPCPCADCPRPSWPLPRRPNPRADEPTSDCVYESCRPRDAGSQSATGQAPARHHRTTVVRSPTQMSGPDPDFGRRFRISMPDPDADLRRVLDSDSDSLTRTRYRPSTSESDIRLRLGLGPLPPSAVRLRLRLLPRARPQKRSFGPTPAYPAEIIEPPLLLHRHVASFSQYSLFLKALPQALHSVCARCA